MILIIILDDTIVPSLGCFWNESIKDKCWNIHFEVTLSYEFTLYFPCLFISLHDCAVVNCESTDNFAWIIKTSDWTIRVVDSWNFWIFNRSWISVELSIREEVETFFHKVTHWELVLFFVSNIIKTIWNFAFTSC